MIPFNVHSVHYDVHKNVHTPLDLPSKNILFKLVDNIYYIISTRSMYMNYTCTYSFSYGILKLAFLEVFNN